MKSYKIYTAGKMGGLSYPEQMEWRRELEIKLRDSASYTGASMTFIHPPNYYQPGAVKGLLYEKEGMEWDLRQLKDSDIVVVSLKGINSSIGTIQEIAVAKEVGKIIVAICRNTAQKEELHPWIRLSVTHFSETVEDAAQYITDFCMI